MNRSSRRISKKQAESDARRRITWIHIMIAVVAIIECVILVTFTTFSWIESNSSLVIQNGPESSQVDTNITKKMDIADVLTSTINLNYSGDDFAPLNKFFSEVKYFEFAKATSSDGRTMFFPCRNNTYSEAGKYRKGDTIDYNTSYLYFDFIMSNKAHDGGPANIENRDVYFDNSAGFTDIFTVSGDGLTTEQKTALTDAMRMSITTQVGSGSPSTRIFSKNEYSGSSQYDGSSGSYKSIDNVAAAQSYAYDENGGTGHDNNRNTWVTTNRLSDFVYHDTNNVVDSEKLFVVRKNADTKVSFRIWFDVWDPVFRSEFGLDSLDYSDFEESTAAYWKIPSATVGIKFKLKTNGNDLRSIYFDDYTLTNKTGINIYHLTDEPDTVNDPPKNYSVWFYVWQPAVSASSDHPAREAGYYRIKLERESSDSVHTRWSANTATASEMEYLMNSGEYYNSGGNNRYQKSYFCYGDYDSNTAIYRWELPAAPVSEDFTFNAYSYMPNSTYTPASSSGGWSDCSGSNIKRGVGIWQDDEASTMTLLKFRDMGTAVTTTNYNGGDNYQIIQNAAESDNHTKYLVYANNCNESTLANNYSDNVAKRTAAMYYDSSEEVFRSYVPKGWLTGNSGVSFSYSPGGVYSDSGVTIRWYNNSPQPLNNEYLYTALGYSNRYDNSTLGGIGYVPGFYNNSSGYLKGVGTWRDVELISFSTELIDADISSAYRYFVGITDTFSAGYYVLRPDSANMTFSAYVPESQGETSPGVNFVRMNSAKTGNDGTSPGAYWYGNTRGNYSTFYPVTVNSSAADPAVYDRGYWNISVLVDGTYENLIYDTLTDGDHESGSPVNTYVPIVTSGTKTIDDVSGTPTVVNHDSVNYKPRDNYGLLEYSYDNQNWVTLADDTTDTLDNSLDRYRFYVNAENHNTVYWRWTPYANYTITFYTEGVSKTVTAADTQFTHTHDVTDSASSGIYLVVTEAPVAQSENSP